MAAAPDHSEFLAEVGAAGVVAVLRGSNAADVTAAAMTLAEAGVRVLEITLTVPDSTTIIADLVKNAPSDVIVGAGTLRTVQDIDDVLAAGAQFLVSPGLTPALLAAVADTAVPFIPGINTPSELMTALDGGAAAVKLFPGSLGGPGYLRALRGPFPSVAIMPTGGVTPDNVNQWFDAGAFAVGAGSDLAPTKAVANRDAAELRSRAERYLAAVTRARSQADSPAGGGWSADSPGWSRG